MKHLLAFILGLTLVVAAALGYSLTRTPDLQNASAAPPSHFVVNGRTFAISYLATTESERETGLMNRTITDSTTMLFIFPERGYYSFWMYHTNSSLDIMWFTVNGGNGTVVYLVKAAPSCYVANQCSNYAPAAEANYVLEAKAGFAEANSIEVGTTVEFR